MAIISSQRKVALIKWTRLCLYKQFGKRKHNKNYMMRDQTKPLREHAIELGIIDN